MTARPAPVLDASGELEACSLCGCRWRLDTDFEQPKDEWCAERDPDGGCRCHRPAYIAGFLRAKLRNPVVVDGEEVVAYIAEVPFSSFRDEVGM